MKRGWYWDQMAQMKNQYVMNGTHKVPQEPCDIEFLETSWTMMDAEVMGCQDAQGDPEEQKHLYVYKKNI